MHNYDDWQARARAKRASAAAAPATAAPPAADVAADARLHKKAKSLPDAKSKGRRTRE